MTRQQLERHQVWAYLVAILAGLAVGSAVPGMAPAIELVLWPALGLLLYATFTQVPLTHLPDAFRDRNFMTAALLGNFVLVPLLVWALLPLLPDEPAIKLGVLLVLLVPCTDWVITFTHLGRGDTHRAVAITPVNLLLQLALLPIYLWLFLGETFAEIVTADRVAAAFILIVLLPLAGAYLTERWAERQGKSKAVAERMAWLPVPLLAMVVFLVAASQVQTVLAALPVMGALFGVFVAYLIAAALIGAGLGRLFKLDAKATSTLIFSLGTRNSFIVLPFALALDAPWQASAVVIVFQSLIELLGMVAYLWAVPRLVSGR